MAQRQEAVEVHLRQTLVVRLGAGAVDLLAGELDQTVEVGGIALLEEIVGEHGDERGRERDGTAEGYAVGHQALERLQERQIGAGDALIEPLLLHHRRVFGMTDEGQVRVQHEG